MKKFIKSLQKKGQAGVSKHMNSLVGGLIVVVLATALAPEMFENIDGLTEAAGVPSWVPSVLLVIVGAGIVFLIWKAFDN